MPVQNYLIAIGLLGVLIAIHEAGHFLVARWAGMRVDRFSIGFGPALFTFVRGGTEWRLGALPFGGYVKIAGMSPGDGTEPDDPGSYASKPAWKRLLVILAGPVTNYVLAWVILFSLLMIGLGPVSSHVGKPVPDMPAAAAGLRAGDRIVAVGDAKVETFSELAARIGESAGSEVVLTVDRGGAELQVPVTPTAEGKIGVEPGTERVSRPFGLLESARRATLGVVGGSLEIFVSLVQLVSGQGAANLMGPPGIVREVAKQVDQGLLWLVMIAAQLSLALGFFNLLPLPALDGGRAAFLGVELIRRRPLDQRAESIVHAIGFLLLLGLILFVSIGDVGKMIRGDEPGAPAAKSGTHAPEAPAPEAPATAPEGSGKPDPDPAPAPQAP